MRGKIKIKGKYYYVWYKRVNEEDYGWKWLCFVPTLGKECFRGWGDTPDKAYKKLKEVVKDLTK